MGLFDPKGPLLGLAREKSNGGTAMGGILAESAHTLIKDLRIRPRPRPLTP